MVVRGVCQRGVFLMTSPSRACTSSFFFGTPRNEVREWGGGGRGY